MAYQIKVQESSDSFGVFQKYRISNGSGAYVVISPRGAALEQVVLCSKDEPDMAALTTPGGIRFFADGAEIAIPAQDWEVSDHGENWLLFDTAKSAVAPRIALRYAWMDHERLVLDIMADEPTENTLTFCTDFSFSLGGSTSGDYKLTTYSCRTSVTDENGLLLPDSSECVTVPGEGLRPVAELICPESDMTMTAYTTLPQLRIRRGDGVGLNSGCAESCSWPQRVVYGFDPIYHGPNKVYPFAF